VLGRRGLFSGRAACCGRGHPFCRAAHGLETVTPWNSVLFEDRILVSVGLSCSLGMPAFAKPAGNFQSMVSGYRSKVPPTIKVAVAPTVQGQLTGRPRPSVPRMRLSRRGGLLWPSRTWCVLPIEGVRNLRDCRAHHPFLRGRQRAGQYAKLEGAYG